MRLVLPILLLAAREGGSAHAGEDYLKTVVTRDFLSCTPAVADVTASAALWKRFLAADAPEKGVSLVSQMCAMMKDDLALTVRTIDDVRRCQRAGLDGLEPSLKSLQDHARFSREGMTGDCR